MIVGLTVGIVVAMVMFIISSNAKASTKVLGRPAHIEAIESRYAPEEVLAKLSVIPQGSSFRVDETYRQPNAICLTWTPDLMTYGWFFPIFVSPSEGGSRIEIGIVPRLVGGARPAKKYMAKAVEHVQQMLQ